LENQINTLHKKTFPEIDELPCDIENEKDMHILTYDGGEIPEFIRYS
jgi:hypothetical protein